MTIKTRITTRVRRTFERVPPRKHVLDYLVYYDGGPTSVAALREACEMAEPGTRVTAVFLDVVPQEHEITDDTPVNDMLAKAILAAATVNARTYNVEIKTIGIPCHFKGPALVAFAAQQDNAVLFLGVTPREMEGQLNSFTEYVLALAPCKVVLVGA
jgi:nucleotide-binding universal stress UspA family protein